MRLYAEYAPIVTHRTWRAGALLASVARMSDRLTADDKEQLRRFGQRIAELRGQKGWSQERLALESGLARSYVGGIERGQRNLALINILRLARALAASPADLFAHCEA